LCHRRHRSATWIAGGRRCSRPRRRRQPGHDRSLRCLDAPGAGGERARLPIREHVDRPVGGHVDEHGAVDVPTPQREVVDPASACSRAGLRQNPTPTDPRRPDQPPPRSRGMKPQISPQWPSSDTPTRRGDLWICRYRCHAFSLWLDSDSSWSTTRIPSTFPQVITDPRFDKGEHVKMPIFGPLSLMPPDANAVDVGRAFGCQGSSLLSKLESSSPAGQISHDTEPIHAGAARSVPSARAVVSTPAGTQPSRSRVICSLSCLSADIGDAVGYVRR
jgi:hypothetical protein